MMLMASAGRLAPTHLSTVSAMVSAAPVCSRKTPMIVPAMMTMPIRSTVPPKPFMMVLVTSIGFIPAAKPTKKDAASSARNACTLNLEISSTIITIATASMTSNIGPCTMIPLLSVNFD